MTSALIRGARIQERKRATPGNEEKSHGWGISGEREEPTLRGVISGSGKIPGGEGRGGNEILPGTRFFRARAEKRSRIVPDRSGERRKSLKVNWRNH